MLKRVLKRDVWLSDGRVTPQESSPHHYQTEPECASIAPSLLILPPLAHCMPQVLVNDAELWNRLHQAKHEITVPATGTNLYAYTDGI